MQMAKGSNLAQAPRYVGGVALLGLLLLLMLSACAVEVRNPQPAQELAQRAKPPGSVHSGWRVFQDRCAHCHGADALGTAQGPDLMPRVREMGPRRFVALVLNRYEWDVPVPRTGGQRAASDQLIDDVIERRQGALAMPAWQAEPRVNAHIIDLYAWLSARAQGTQGPGRPPP